jgi:hypothetical protein
MFKFSYAPYVVGMKSPGINRRVQQFGLGSRTASERKIDQSR